MISIRMALAAAAAIPAAALGQNPAQQPGPQVQQPAPQVQQPAAQAQPAAPAQQGCADTAGQGRNGQKKSFGHDVGNAAAVGGSQVAGAAVAGPVGAVVAPVVVDHVGRAVKRVVKGKKKPNATDAARQQQCTGQPAQQ